MLIVGIALLQVLRTNSVEKEIYWTGPSTELEGTVLGSGYILSLGLVKWIAISMPSPVSSTWSTAHHFESCLHSHLKRFQVVNETAYASEKRRWTLVTQNLKQDSAWEETASYYLNLEWAYCRGDDSVTGCSSAGIIWSPHEINSICISHQNKYRKLSSSYIQRLNKPNRMNLFGAWFA